MTRCEAIRWQDRLFPTTNWTKGTGTPGDNFCTWGHRPTLCEICLDLRMSCNGASDPWGRGWLAEVRDMLKARAETWDDDLRDCAMDAAVKMMVLEAVKIADAELASDPA